MKRCILLAGLTLLCLTALAQSAADGDGEEGFEPLFDGKSFTGWRVSDKTPESWRIKDGLLVLTGGSSHLFTKEQFDDFIVRFEWRPAKKGYNSGFFIRGRQIQMAQGGAGRLFGSEGTRGVPQLHNPPGQWNEWEVTCIGPKVSLKVNGKPAWEIDDFKPVRGPLGFEAEGHAIEFRNIRVKRIPALDEAASLPLVLRDLPPVQRVIVVNNDSTDGTAAVAFAHGATVVHETVRGYGAACLRGLAAVAELVEAGEPPPQVLAFLDADYSDHPDLPPQIVEPVLSGQAEFVVGSRLKGQREPGAMPPQSVFGNRLACFLMRQLFRAHDTDLGPCMALWVSVAWPSTNAHTRSSPEQPERGVMSG